MKKKMIKKTLHCLKVSTTTTACKWNVESLCSHTNRCLLFFYFSTQGTLCKRLIRFEMVIAHERLISRWDKLHCGNTWVPRTIFAHGSRGWVAKWAIKVTIRVFLLSGLMATVLFKWILISLNQTCAVLDINDVTNLSLNKFVNQSKILDLSPHLNFKCIEVWTN